jgi:ATP-binding cassette subfamily B protein
VIRSLARLLEGTRWLVGLSLAAAVAQSLALVPVGLIVRHVFDTVIPRGDRGQLVILGLAALGLYLVASGLSLVSRYVVLDATKRAVARLRCDLLARIQTLPQSWLDRADVGQVHSTVVQDSERVDVMVNALLGLVLPAIVITTALLGTLAFVDLRLLALLLTVIPVLMVLGRVLTEQVRGRVRRFQSSFDTFSSRILANLRAATTIRTLGAEPTELGAGAAEIAALSEEGRRMAWLAQAQAVSQGTTAALAGIIVLVLGGLGVIGHDLSLGDLLSFFTLLALARGQATQVLTWLPQMVIGRESLGRLDRLLETEAPPPYRGGRRIAFRGEVALEGVSFDYGAGPVLHEVDLGVQSGERVALSGPNGAGKSTIVGLLLGLYRPDRGRLTADGVPYDELDVRELRLRIGVLLQDPVLFRGTVRANIAYGRSGVREEEVVAAAEAATAAEAIAGLSAGYDAEVGDDGELLSGGERQRVALARALLGRPPLLILDEPSTHLDATATGRLLENLAALPWEPTVLLITHDPQVAAVADRVVEIRDGRLVPGAVASGA